MNNQQPRQQVNANQGERANREDHGKPLPFELCKRIMEALEAGDRPSHVARRLMVSPATVYRSLGAKKLTGETVPKPLPSGGYRGSFVDCDLITFLAVAAAQNPKLAVKELLDEAGQKDLQ